MKLTGAGVLYILKEKFDLYTNALPTILSFPFTNTTVKDLTVINKELLQKNINEFITSNTIPPTNLIIVIGDNAASIDEQAPFDHVISKKITTQQSEHIFTTNPDLYTIVKEAFEIHGFAIEFVLPGIVFSNTISQQETLTFENATTIFQEALTMQQYNLLTKPEGFKIPGEDEIAALEKKAQRKRDVMRLYAYINVFGVMIIAVVVIWNTMYRTPSQDYRGKAATNQTPTPSQWSEAKQITITISDPYSSTRAQQAKNLLAKYHFQSITIADKVVSTQTKTIIIFSPKVSPTTRTAVLKEMQTLLPTIATRESSTAAFDIIIMLGK